MLGKLTVTTTDQEAMVRDTRSNKTAPSPTTVRNTATTDAAKLTKVKPFQLYEEQELRMDQAKPTLEATLCHDAYNKIVLRAPSNAK